MKGYRFDSRLRFPITVATLVQETLPHCFGDKVCVLYLGTVEEHLLADAVIPIKIYISKTITGFLMILSL